MSIFTWFKAWRQRREDDEDLQEEIRAHLAMAAADRMADGADPTTARQASLKEFGNVTLTREAAHRVWTPSWLDTLRDYVSDVRYAGRALAKHRTFSLTVIAVLTIGIGLNAVVFTMLKSMALSPIAGVERSASLGVLYGQTNAGRDLALSYPDYQYFRDHDTAFSGLLGSRVITATMGRGKGARPVYGEVVSSNYFDVLGVRAAAGRTLQPSDEEAPGRAPVVVISDALWRQTFNADPAIIGTTLEINNQMLTVVGVTDPTFHGTVVSYDVEVFIPVMMAPQLGFRFSSTETTPSAILADRRANVFYAMGRLRPGTTIAGAREQAGAVWTTLAANRPLSDVVQRVNIVPFWQSPGTAPAVMLPVLIALSATGLLVLLIACANIAGLVVARGSRDEGRLPCDSLLAPHGCVSCDCS